jgi:hypothetical protein
LLQKLENREMQVCPSIDLLRDSPASYIKQLDACVKDRIGFRRLANATYRRMRFYVFRDPPLANISVGAGGHVFMNSHRLDQPRLVLHNLCEIQLHPNPKLVTEMDTLFTAMTSYYQPQGPHVTIAAVPTTYSLYAQYLPVRIGKGLRDACRAYPTSDSLLSQLARRSTEEKHYDLYYPLDLFRTRSKDPLFYPENRFHWSGESAFLFARSLLMHSGAVDKPYLDDPSQVQIVEDDLSMFFGFARTIKARTYAYKEFTTVVDVPDWAQDLSKNGGLHQYTTRGALSDYRGLLIANSFGIELSQHLAKGFTTFFYYNLNHIPKENEEELRFFREIVKKTKPDFLYFVLDDAGIIAAPERLGSIAQLLATQQGIAKQNRNALQSSKP